MRLSYNVREPVKAHYPKALQHKGLRRGEGGRAAVSAYAAIGYSDCCHALNSRRVIHIGQLIRNAPPMHITQVDTISTNLSILLILSILPIHCCLYQCPFLNRRATYATILG